MLHFLCTIYDKYTKTSVHAADFWSLFFVCSELESLQDYWDSQQLYNLREMAEIKMVRVLI